MKQPNKSNKYVIIDTLKDSLDDAQSKIWELQDKSKRLEEVECGLQGAVQKRTELQRENNTLERTIMELKRQLGDSETNRSYAANQISEQSSVIQALRLELDRLRNNAVNAEHLAAQVVRLQNENVKLKTDNATLADDNNKFREQTTRLISEKAELTCRGSFDGAKCGICLACKLDQTEAILERTVKNLTQANIDRNDYKASWDLNYKERNRLQKVVEKLERDVEYYQNINRILSTAMKDITTCGLFQRWGIADKALYDAAACLCNKNTNK